jgi:hypothetical protein
MYVAGVAVVLVVVVVVDGGGEHASSSSNCCAAMKGVNCACGPNGVPNIACCCWMIACAGAYENS